jgi:hypothetical protein
MNRRYFPLILVIIVYLVVGSLYAIYTPMWQAPDEPAHYNYIRQLAAGTFPIIESGDYDQEYQGTVISSRFDPQYSIQPFSYEDWQPPLYYLLQAPVFGLFNGALLPLRLVSVLLGAGVVAAAFGVGQRIWPKKVANPLALTTAIFVAFLPQHLAIMASINNDALAELIIALILLLLLGLPVQKGSTGRTWLLIGLLLGLGFLTKATVYIMVPVVGLALIGHYWRHWPDFWRAAGRVALPAGVLGLLWWARNLIVYPGLDPLATFAHDAVVVGQPRTIEWIALYGAGDVALRFLRTTFQSFWGQFGWMAVPMPVWVYLPLLGLILVAGAGLAWSAVKTGDRRPETGEKTADRPETGEKTADRRRQTADGKSQTADLSGSGVRQPVVDSQRRAVGEKQTQTNHPASPVPGPRSSVPSPVPGLRSSIVILLSTFLLTLLVYLYYNATFVQHQGRYLFPALIPIAVGVTQGLWVVARPVLARLPTGNWWLPAGLALVLVSLDLLALFRFIIPYLSFSG